VPASPRLVVKILVNTLVTALVWGIADYFYIRSFLRS
jgi:hypothetical protein